jgi:pentatricopeptide repeat protein
VADSDKLALGRRRVFRVKFYIEIIWAGLDSYVCQCECESCVYVYEGMEKHGIYLDIFQ